MNKSTITTIIVVIVIIIAGGIYFWKLGNSSAGGTNLVVSQVNNSSISVGADELALLNQVNTIRIRSDFFSSDIFLSLQDMVQPVQTVDMFRTNPFAPVPGIASPFTQAQSQTQTQTQGQSSIKIR